MDTSTLQDTANKVYDGTAGKILEMLGNGLAPEIVASAIGVTPGYVSQLLQEESFATQVTNKRFVNLQAATNRDREYDAIEDALLAKMKDLLPVMYKPMEVLRAITVINAAKRRGASAPENTTINSTVVQLVLPQVITQRFVKNETNQVIEAGDQALITIQASQLQGLTQNASKQLLPAAPSTS